MNNPLLALMFVQGLDLGTIPSVKVCTILGMTPGGALVVDYEIAIVQQEIDAEGLLFTAQQARVVDITALRLQCLRVPQLRGVLTTALIAGKGLEFADKNGVNTLFRLPTEAAE